MTTAKPAKAKATVQKDIDILDPKTNVVTLQSGTQVEVVRLKSRQLFKLLRIVTHGVGDSLSALRIDPDDSDSAFAVKIVTTLAFAIPEAEDEAIEFIQAMVKPVGLIERRGLSDADQQRNAELWTTAMYELENPEIDDIFTVIEKVIYTEAPNLKSLGKRLVQMFNLAMKGNEPVADQSSTE